MSTPETARPEPQPAEKKIEHVSPREREQAATREQEALLEASVESTVQARQKVIEGGPEFAQEVSQELATLEQAGDLTHEVQVELERATALPEKPTEKAPSVEKTRETEGYKELMAVRLTDNFPIVENGRVKLKTPMAATKGEVPRASLHFSLNRKVESHLTGSWDKRGIALLAPMDGLVRENGVPTGLNQLDTFWVSGDGVQLPPGTKVLYRSETAADPRLRQLRTFCETNKVGIEFEETDDMSGATLEQRLSTLGYQRLDPSGETERAIAQKSGVRLKGSDKIHAESGLPYLEGAMMQSNPDQPDSLRQSPVAVLRLAGELSSVLPPEVTAQHTSIARARLDRFISRPQEAQRLFLAQAQEKLGRTPTAEELFSQEATFYDELSEFALKGDDQPDLMRTLADKVGSDAFEAGGADRRFAKQLETLDPSTRATVIERFAKVGGPAAVHAMELCEQKLTPAEKQTIARGTLANMEAFRTGRNLKELAPIMKYLKSNEGRDFFDQNFGPEFYNYFYTR